MPQTSDLRIESVRPLISPAKLREQLPLDASATHTIYQARGQISKILHGQDDRLLVVVGPCSIHDVDAALEYAQLIAKARDNYADQLCIVMRVYFEKPRTTIGWKGLINNPDLDNSFDSNKGIYLARKLLLNLAQDGIPAGVEFLDQFTPQYLTELVSWGAIGARTTEDQGHRQLASGLSCPVGFKNGTDGNIQIAVDAVNAARHSHSFPLYNKDNHAGIFTTTGNSDTHIILRGGTNGPNYQAQDISRALEQLEQANLPGQVMVDCSHANSKKQYKKQLDVAANLAQQICRGSRAINGVMVESNLKAGKQTLSPNTTLEYGQSITDACLDWQDTEQLLANLAQAVQTRRDKKAIS